MQAGSKACAPRYRLNISLSRSGPKNDEMNVRSLRCNLGRRRYPQLRSFFVVEAKHGSNNRNAFRYVQLCSESSYRQRVGTTKRAGIDAIALDNKAAR